MDMDVSAKADRATAAEPIVSALRDGIANACRNCGEVDGWGWVCENHLDRPWGGVSARDDACDCGAGAPCPVCYQCSPWQPIRFYNEKYDGSEVLIAGGTYYYDAATFTDDEPFDGVGLASLYHGEWRGGYGSEYDGQYWYKPELYMRIPPAPPQGMSTGTAKTKGLGAKPASPVATPCATTSAHGS